MIDDDKLQVPGEFDVIDWEIPQVVGDWRTFDWQDPDDERLATIQEEFEIEEAVADADSELEKIFALKRWVRSRWDHGWSHSYDTVEDALDILREAERGEPFNCEFYSRVFVACATALGIPARRLGLGVADCSFPRGHGVGNIGHSVAEAWSNDLADWVLIDCDMNMHYERDGVPMRALDVHDAWLSGKQGEVTPVYEEPAFVFPNERTLDICAELYPTYGTSNERIMRLKMERFGRNDVMDYYARLRFYAKQSLTWLDRRCPPTLVRHFEPNAWLRYTNNEADIYPTLNAVRIGTDPTWDRNGASVTVTLDHCMPWFDRYEARVDGEQWRSCDGEFEWRMQEGSNRLDVRAVNRCGRPGIISSVEVAYAAPIW